MPNPPDIAALPQGVQSVYYLEVKPNQTLYHQ